MDDKPFSVIKLIIFLPMGLATNLPNFATPDTAPTPAATVIYQENHVLLEMNSHV